MPSIVPAGHTTIQVWDLYSGLEVQIFRPIPSVSSAEDYHITALAAGVVHGHQVCTFGLLALLYLPHYACLLQHDSPACLSTQSCCQTSTITTAKVKATVPV